MKQTVVEWLNEALTFSDTSLIPKDIYEQAKKMELAQRIDDYTNGHMDREKDKFQLPISN